MYQYSITFIFQHLLSTQISKKWVCKAFIKISHCRIFHCFFLSPEMFWCVKSDHSLTTYKTNLHQVYCTIFHTSVFYDDMFVSKWSVFTHPQLNPVITIPKYLKLMFLFNKTANMIFLNFTYRIQNVQLWKVTVEPRD